jgi:hypothetical protein
MGLYALFAYEALARREGWQAKDFTAIACPRISAALAPADAGSSPVPAERRRNRPGQAAQRNEAVARRRLRRHRTPLIAGRKRRGIATNSEAKRATFHKPLPAKAYKISHRDFHQPSDNFGLVICCDSVRTKSTECKLSAVTLSPDVINPKTICPGCTDLSLELSQ